MPSILIELDEASFNALDRAAVTAKCSRTRFVREAIKVAIRKQECAEMHEAYRQQPDSTEEADDWSSCEKFEA